MRAHEYTEEVNERYKLSLLLRSSLIGLMCSQWLKRHNNVPLRMAIAMEK